MLFVAGYCITPFWDNCREKPNTNADSSVVVTPGIPDTVFIEGKTTYGIIQDTVYVVKNLNPGQFETNLDTTLEQGTKAHVRHTTWYWPDEEGVSFAKSLEWNITERPCQEITQIDTAYVTKYTTPSFWDNRFIPYLGGGVIYNPATKAVDWGIQLGFGIRLN